MKIAVIIPCYKVKNQILGVIEQIKNNVHIIIAVDDKCPEESGKYIQENCSDKRVKVLFNEINLGVGGAVKRGLKYAMTLDNIDIFVKLDGDGQMPPYLINKIIKPILSGEADYTKGNRFFDLESLNEMPPLRIFGNSMLSLINKFVNGYWHVMDPTNGFVAIHINALKLLPLDKIENRYFFESDMLFRLATINAVVQDVPMKSYYNDENSSLSISNTAFKFPLKYINRFIKRVFYNYFLRDFNLATLELLFGGLLSVFGILMGTHFWVRSIKTGVVATTGQVMIATLPILIGFILLMLALHVDLISIPRKPLSKIDFSES